jgi:diguanylate cyclase (GGDEF)-like protein
MRMSLDDLGLRTKMLIPLMAIGLVVLAMVAFSGFELASTSGKASEIIERRVVAASDLGRASRGVVSTTYSLYGGLIYDSTSLVGRTADEGFPKAIAQVNAHLDEAMKLAPDKTPEIAIFKERFAAIVEKTKRPLEIGLHIPGLSTGRKLKPEELDLLAQGAILMADIDLQTRALVDDMMKSNQAMLAENAQAAADLRARSSNAMITMAAVDLVATLIAVAFSHWLSSLKIAAPLARLANRMRALAKGDLTAPIEGQVRRDEIGDMARAMLVFKEAAVENDRLEREAAMHRARDVETHLETRRLSDENHRLANLDSLTGLPNRRRFFSVLNQVHDRAVREKLRFVVAVIDLDGLKSVNDLYGHATGDRIIVEAGRRVRDICDDTIFFSRLGGDVFGLIVEADLDEDAKEALGARICQALDATFIFPGIAVDLSGSIGFAAFPRAATSPEQLFERAGYALYHAKQHRRGRPVIFSIEHETEIRQIANLERCLRHADIESEMSLYFQPIVDVERGKVVAFEALARWDSPILGRVAPDIFIRVAERSDLINKLTRMLLRRALAKAKTWPDDIRVSFNLSMRDLGSREAIVNIVAIIENSGIAASRIDLEVTETALIQDFDQANASLQSLKALGVSVSLDDFGTGYSSLSYIRRFPIDKIKIDRSFVKEVETEPSCRAIVKSVIDLCRNMKLTCIVEGMETADQVNVLRTLGCRTMQGYLFGKPMPAAEVLGFLDTTNFSMRLKAPADSNASMA